MLQSFFIQKVLSIMKTRQIAATGVTPLLIRKISRGMKPASVLVEQKNNQQSKLSHINSQMNNIHIQKENLFMSKGDHLLENENMFLKYDRKGVSNLNVNLKSNIEQYQNLQKGINGSVNKYGNFHKKKVCLVDNIKCNIIGNVHLSFQNIKIFLVICRILDQRIN